MSNFRTMSMSSIRSQYPGLYDGKRPPKKKHAEKPAPKAKVVPETQKTPPKKRRK
jgi:hypothetical protein